MNLIDKNLKKYLPKGKDVLSKAMRYSALSGGKRIRPRLVIESALLCGGSAKDAMPVACAAEFVHAYSLIHDDLPAMDDDDFRRGKPSCHKAFGEANAILAGDALLTLAFATIARNVPAKAGLRIIEELSFSVGSEGMLAGQALDLENRSGGRSKDIIKKTDLLKTARLFEFCTKAGGIIAGASKKELDALQRFGVYFGLSFQAVDDSLDEDSSRLKEAASLMEKAKSSLKIFGKKGKNLNKISEDILYPERSRETRRAK